MMIEEAWSDTGSDRPTFEAFVTAIDAHVRKPSVPPEETHRVQKENVYAEFKVVQ